MSAFAEHGKAITKAVKVLIAAGFVVQRKEHVDDATDGETLLLLLRFDPLRDTDII